jgi:hypothetical protein
VHDSFGSLFHKEEAMRLNAMMLGVVLLAPVAVRPQAPPSAEWPVAAGSRVKILSPVLGERAQTGNVVSAAADTLVFRQARDAASVAIATPNIVKIEVSRGTHTRKAKGALLGFLIGAAAGAAIGAAAYKKPKPCGFCFLQDTRAFDTTLGGVLGGVIGTGIGVIVGARQTDTWVPVAVPRTTP